MTEQVSHVLYSLGWLAKWLVIGTIATAMLVIVLDIFFGWLKEVEQRADDNNNIIMHGSDNLRGWYFHKRHD